MPFIALAENTIIVGTNHVLLVKIEGPVWYTIHHHLPVVKGVNNPSIDQPTNGKSTSMVHVGRNSLFVRWLNQVLHNLFLLQKS